MKSPNELCLSGNSIVLKTMMNILTHAPVTTKKDIVPSSIMRADTPFCFNYGKHCKLCGRYISGKQADSFSWEIIILKNFSLENLDLIQVDDSRSYSSRERFRSWSFRSDSGS